LQAFNLAATAPIVIVAILQPPCRPILRFSVTSKVGEWFRGLVRIVEHRRRLSTFTNQMDIDHRE
jgi:hypothetical protein